MAVDVSRLGIEVESKGIKEATDGLDKLTNSAAKAEKAATGLKNSSEELSTSQKNSVSATDKVLQKMQQQVDLFGASSTKAFTYKAALKGLSDDQIEIARGLGAQADQLKYLAAQQSIAEKEMRQAAATAESYAKAQGMANEMNKRFDAKTLAADLKEQAAATREAEAATRKAAQAQELYANQQGQAIEMNKRIDRKSQADAWRSLGAAQAEAIRMDKQYNAQQNATATTQTRIQSQQRDFIAQLKDQATTYKMTQSELTAYRAAQLGISDQAAPYIKKLQDIETGLGKVGISAKQTAFAFRMLPAQFSDIAVQLAGGQNPFLILLQQGSQIKDSFGGIGPTFKAFASALTPARLAVGGLVTAMAALGAAYYIGSQELTEFNKQMIITNGYAGITTDQFQALATSIGGIQGGRNNAAKVLTEVASSGQIAANNIEMVTKAAVEMQYNTGQSVEKTIAQFKAIEKDPVSAIQKLNDSYHFLTASVFEQIAALEKQGEHEDAVKLAMSEYAKSIDSTTPKIVQNLGMIERAWKGIKDSVTGAFNAAMSIGRVMSSDEQIKQLQERIDFNKKQAGGFGGPSQKATENANALLQTQIDLIEADKRQASSAMTKQNETAKANKEAIEGIDLVNKKLETMKGPDKLNKELKEISKAFEDIYKKNPNSDLLKGVSFENGSPTSGGAYQKLIDEAKRKDIRKTPTNENDIQQELQKYQNLYKLEEKAFKSYSDQMKLLRDGNTISEIEYLDNVEQAEQTSLTKRLAILNDEKGVAAKKKNKTAMERINGEIAIVEQQLTEALDKNGYARKKVWDKEAENLTAYTSTLENTLKTRKMAIEDALTGATLGDVAKGEAQRLLTAKREYDAQFTDLANKAEKGTISPELYQQELNSLNSVYQRRLTIESEYNKDSAALRADWTNGATLALNQYKESVEDVAGQTKTIFSNAFSGMTDALTDFVMTGKLNFGSLAKSIIAQIVKMQVAAASSSIFSTLLNTGLAMFGGSSDGGVTASTAGIANTGSTNGGIIDAAAGGSYALGGAFDKGVQKFADGGAFTNGIVSTPTNFNKAQMGEAGPEAIVPLARTSDGSLGVTMQGAGGGGDSNISINNNITINQDGSATSDTSTQDTSESAKQLNNLIANKAKEVIAQEQRQGGLIWKMMNGTRY